MSLQVNLLCGGSKALCVKTFHILNPILTRVKIKRSQRMATSPRKRSPRKLVPLPVKRRSQTVPQLNKSQTVPKTLHHFFAKQTKKAEATQILKKIGDTPDEAVVIEDSDSDYEDRRLGSSLARQLFSPSPTKLDGSECSNSQSQRTQSSAILDDSAEQPPDLQLDSEIDHEPGAQNLPQNDVKPVIRVVSPLKEPNIQLEDDDTDEFMAKLPEPEESPSQQASPNYTAKTFSFVYKKVLRKNVFTVSDRELLEKFFTLAENAQELWLRLYQRKHQWISRQRINYKIEYIDCSLRELVSAGFLYDKRHLKDLKVLLDLLPQKDVIVLGKKFCDGKKCTTKAATIEELITHSGRKDVLFGGQRIRENILKCGQQLVEQCYLIEGSLATAVTRAFTLVSLGSHFDTFTSAADKNDHGICNLYTISQFMRNKFDFAEYVVVDVFPFLFTSPEEFALYCEARLHVFKLAKLIETYNWDGALNAFEEAYKWFMKSYTRERFIKDAALPWFLHRFSFSHCLLRCLAAGAEISERHKRYQDAVDLYSTILSQNAFQQNRRGSYWVRLLLDVDAHLKLPRNSLCLASLAFEDNIAPQQMFDIFTRAKRLSRRYNISLPQLEKFLPPTEAPVETIDGQLVKRNIIGRRNVFASVDEAGERVVGPEAVAIEHYLQHGFTHGVHGETRTIHMLFAVLCWDVFFGAPSELEPATAEPKGIPFTLNSEIESLKQFFEIPEVVPISDDDDDGTEDKDAEGHSKDTEPSSRKRRGKTRLGKASKKAKKRREPETHVQPIPYGKYFRPDLFPKVFEPIQHDVNLQKAIYINEYQSGPLDLGYPEFYLNRRQAIDDHLATLSAMTSEEIVVLGRDNYEKHSGRVNPLFSWELLSLDEVISLLGCIPVEVLVSICRQLLVDFRFYRSGFPDVILWNGESRRWKVLEVKGPGDVLSTKQRYWMHLLLSLGVDCVTCRVSSVNSRKIRA